MALEAANIVNNNSHRRYRRPSHSHSSTVFIAAVFLIFTCYYDAVAPANNASTSAAASATEQLPPAKKNINQQPVAPTKPGERPRKSTHFSRNNNNDLWASEIYPISYILEERRRERRRQLKEGGNESSSKEGPSIQPYPQHWFAAEQNAVYGTIPDKDDPAHVKNTQLQEFYATRHLSRYERQYRIQRGLDLQIGWDGIYEFDIDSNERSIDMDDEYNRTSNDSSVVHRHGRRAVEDFSASSSSSSSSQQQQHYGGQFNHYQAVPLSQGYGTHFANVWVGSPIPQRKTVIVDTGSHYTAFPCKGCQNCGEPHHTDLYFDPQKSASFQWLQCNECKDGVACDNGQCKFSQRYTEGSSWDAVQVQDTFYCGGSDVLDSVEPVDQKFKLKNFMFGCQTSMSGLFITQLADGIMGMSQHEATLPKQLYDKGLIEHNLFAMCYRRELGTSKRGVTAGSMTFGGVSNDLDTSPMIYAKNMAKLGWFTVYVKNIYIRTRGGQSALSTEDDNTKHKVIKVKLDPVLLNSGKGVIVDSGTTDTYLNKVVAKEFNKAWFKATGRKYGHYGISLTQNEIRNLPTILIQCHAYSSAPDPSIDDYDKIPGYTGQLDPTSPNDLLIAVPATNYMDYSPITKQYSSRLYFSETAGGVLGSNVMQGHNVLFDWENGRVGFAESTCTYDKKNVPEVARDDGFSTDCMVSEPILSTSCIETVDQRICKNNPTNLALLGTETWTALVENPGTNAGACVDSTKIVKSRKEKVILDDPVVECHGNGMCTEDRPCQLTCAQAAKAAEIVPLPANSEDSQQLPCGDSYWSSCDYNCIQSRLVSVAYTDGICHEVSRITRPCHIGACARSDPCMVPFIVHAVFGFADATVDKWTLASEDIFATALTNAMRDVSSENHFGVGDVNILLVLPWNREDDSPDSGIEEITEKNATGMKVVLEISVFNPLARVNDLSTAAVGGDLVNTKPETPMTSVLRNFTDRLTGRQIKTTCNQDDLYALAKKALRLRKDVLHNPKMIRAIIDELKKLHSGGVDMKDSPFSPIFRGETTGKNHLLLAWTIRTEVDDEINYFGPKKPLWHRILSLFQKILSLVLLLASLITFRNLLVVCCDMDCGQGIRWQQLPKPSMWGKRRHPSLNLQKPNDSDVEDTIMGVGRLGSLRHRGVPTTTDQ